MVLTIKYKKLCKFKNYYLYYDSFKRKSKKNSEESALLIIISNMKIKGKIKLTEKRQNYIIFKDINKRYNLKELTKEKLLFESI